MKSSEEDKSDDTANKGIDRSVTKLFKFASTNDVCLMLFGSVCAVIHGAGWPVLSLVFGQMTNSFLSTEIVSSKVNGSSNATFSGFESPDVDLAGIEITIAMYSIYYAALGALILFVTTAQIGCWQFACENQVDRMRKAFFAQLLRQDLPWFDLNSDGIGEFASTLNDDIERVREGLGDKLSLVIQAIACFIAGYAVGFSTGAKMTAVIGALAPLLALSTAYIGKLTASSAIREQKKYASAAVVAEEVLSNIKTVISLSGQNREVQRYAHFLEAGKSMAKRRYVKMGFGMGISYFILYFSYGLAYFYGTQLVINGELVAGAVFTILFAVIVGSSSIGSAIPHLTVVATAKASADLVHDVINAVPNIDAYSSEGVSERPIKGALELKHVSFAYPTRPTITVLKDFSVKIEPGVTLALVGASGSGKSTIVNLLQRFYDPTSGAILLDGIDLKEWNLAYLRSAIGYVGQEPKLFSRSIEENIKLGNPSASREQIVSAAIQANAHEFICRLPDKYNTRVGERGAQLSGGQKQRIAIARALLRDPKLLILDEATSALDAESESIVQAALESACAGRTTVIIAHRLSTIRHANIICALKDGILAETGTHEQLMAARGVYYELVTSQTFVDMDKSQEKNKDKNKDSEGNSRANSVKIAKRTTSTRSSRAASDLEEAVDQEKYDAADYENVPPASMLKVLSYLKRDWQIVVLNIFSAAIIGTLIPVFAIFYGQIFATFTLPTVDEMRANCIFWSFMFLVIAFTTFVAHISMISTIGFVSENLLQLLRAKAFRNIMAQAIAWFDDSRHASGKLCTRLATDVPMVKSIAGHRLALMIHALFTLAVGLILAYIFGWQLAIAMTAAVPILVIIGGVQFKFMKRNQLRNQRLLEEAGRLSSEVIENVKTVQSLTAEKLFIAEYESKLEQPLKTNRKNALIYGFAYGFSEATIFFIYAAAFRLAAYLVSHSIMSAVNIYRVFFAVSLSAVSVGQVLAYLPDVTKAKLAVGFIFQLIESQSSIDSFSETGIKPSLSGNISFNEVTFRYPSRSYVKVLKGLSLSIKAGQTVALVGPSGCGKSTIMSLLLRFYDTESGLIKIDNYDIKELNINHLRRVISIVSQEPTLFNCSIKDNLVYGLPRRVSDEEIIAVAKEANIHEFIDSLPLKYDTNVGPNGTQLSGGQKQRIAIARALLRNPVILLLDEATSALDTESEKIVQEAIDKARAGRTCIIIAHRLSTIINADAIAVMANGKVVELGTHEQLLAKKGFYYNLTKKQMMANE